MREIFMSYCRHEMTLKALKECKWLGDLDDESEEVIAECARLQKYIIELADEFGCEITNKEDVIKSIEDEKSNLLANLNNMVEYLDSLGCMIWHDDEVVCQIDEEEQRRARV